MKKIIAFSFFLLLSSNGFSQKKNCSITSFGARPDGRTNNTSFIQRAIDETSAAGGGRVTVPAGKFVTGVLYLKTGVELYLAKGSVLLGSTNRLDYGKGTAIALLTAKEQTDIAVTGPGEIDGRGKEVVKDLLQRLETGVLQDAEWKVKRPAEKNRPKLIEFIACKNITVKNITLKNGSGWIQAYIRCEHLTIDSITVIAREYWNNDGIDIVNSKNVSITNCYVDAADDAICLKSEGNVIDSCVNIFIANCKLRSSASAFKIGTGSTGGFRNIRVRNLEVMDTYRSAIALEAVDGGFLENVDIQKIKALNTGNAIFIRLGHRNRDSNYSIVKNIRIAEVYVEVPADKPDKGLPLEGPLLRYPPFVVPATSGTAQSISPWNLADNDSVSIVYRHRVFPSSITGLPGHPVQNIVLENIEIVYEGSAEKEIALFPTDSLSMITEATNRYPEFSMFGELPCWGLYVRHAEAITIKNMVLRYKKTDLRVACIFDDVKRLILDKVAIPSYEKAPLMILRNVQQHSLRQLKLPLEETKAIEIQ